MAGSTQTGIAGGAATESRLIITDAASGFVTLDYQRFEAGDRGWVTAEVITLSPGDISTFKTNVSNLA